MTTTPACCKDCGSTSRALPYPGPRCLACHRAVKRLRKARQHDQHVQRTYTLGPGDYERLLVAQGGRCAIYGCRARGATRALAVEHDHKTGKVRGLCCAMHNEWIGRAGDDPAVFDSLAAYLRDPPARLTLGASAGEGET